MKRYLSSTLRGVFMVAIGMIAVGIFAVHKVRAGRAAARRLKLAEPANAWSGSATGSKVFYFGESAALEVRGKRIQFTFAHVQASATSEEVLKLNIDGRERHVVWSSSRPHQLAIDGRTYLDDHGLRLNRDEAPKNDVALSVPRTRFDPLKD